MQYASQFSSRFPKIVIFFIIYKLFFKKLIWRVAVSPSDLLPENSSPTLNHLDRVSEELRSHVADIRKKLLSISSQIIATELKNWEAKPPVPSKSFLSLSK